MSSASVVGKLERLLNLTAALLNTERLLPAAEIQAKVAGYAADKVAFRRTFERDKNDLRRMGIPLTMGTVPATDPPVEGYRIHKQDYYLTDPGLDADERAALHLAARTVRLEDTSPDAAFWALGGKPSDGEATPEMAVLPSDENLVLLYRAICERRAVSFGYRGEERSAEPLRLHFARGHWYLGTHDRRRDELRHFRLDRIDDLQVGPAGAFTPRRAPARDLGRPPWEIGTDTGVAHLEIDAEVAGWALAQTGDGLRHERRPDGSLWLEVSVANTDALLDFVLGLLERAELLGPPGFAGETPPAAARRGDGARSEVGHRAAGRWGSCGGGECAARSEGRHGCPPAANPHLNRTHAAAPAGHPLGGRAGRGEPGGHRGALRLPRRGALA